MIEDIRQRCVVCNKHIETKRVTQKVCSKRCAGAIGGRKKVPKGFSITGTAAICGAKGGRISKRKVLT